MTFTEEYIVANGEDGEDDNVGTDEDDHDDGECVCLVVTSGCLTPDVALSLHPWKPLDTLLLQHFISVY